MTLSGERPQFLHYRQMEGVVGISRIQMNGKMVSIFEWLEANGQAAAFQLVCEIHARLLNRVSFKSAPCQGEPG